MSNAYLITPVRQRAEQGTPQLKAVNQRGKYMAAYPKHT